MKVEILGNGPPVVSVVGSIHGDEPCGANAINRLIESGPEIENGAVKLIIANEKALGEQQRQIDIDLNRSFPGEPDSEMHEEKLAHRLAAEVSTTPTLSIHSTHSTDEPFLLYNPNDEVSMRMADAMPIQKIVEIQAYDNSGFIRCPQVLEAEAGYQQSPEASENAYNLIISFLKVFNVIEGDVEEREKSHFTLSSLREKDNPESTYEFVKQNFNRVEEDEIYAREEGTPIKSDDAFYPILMSGEGYEDILGYAGQKSEDSFDFSDSKEELRYLVGNV